MYQVLKNESLSDSSIAQNKSASKNQCYVFVAGKGNVGSEFIQMVDALSNQNSSIILAGIANSKAFSVNLQGLNLKSELKPVNEEQSFAEAIVELHQPNAVFVDLTASEEVADVYEYLLMNGVSVIACNKIALGGSYKKYAYLKEVAREKKVFFNYETTVGAALPVISSIQMLKESGDQVHRIEAVLSGSLNYIFNHYDGSMPLAHVVQKALKLGLTEPNPMIDLMGMDVKRKLLILVRELGIALEEEEVQLPQFLSSRVKSSSNVQEFFERLEEEESKFIAMIQKAQSNDAKLKIIAEFGPEGAKIDLKEVDESHPFYSVEGKDNVVSFYTNRYKEQPLIIKGAGAGAEVTASGVLYDLVKIQKEMSWKM